jgi:hypothetical protein
MNLRTDKYLAQAARWPRTGRHILAQFDDQSVIVYQAYRPSIGRFAADHGYFGGEFSLGRMSWVKPNFLWMMYRCGWATKSDQEVVLAVHLRRNAFDEILASAVPSSFDTKRFASQEHWKRSLAESSVRLQWDPDHAPSGEPLERRAIQLGLRGETLARYASEWILRIDDISEFAREQHRNFTRYGLDALSTPAEAPYPVTTPAVAERIGVDDGPVGVSHE